MKLTQLERIKSKLKRTSYEFSKVIEFISILKTMFHNLF
jgi:hypothetical protein